MTTPKPPASTTAPERPVAERGNVDVTVVLSCFNYGRFLLEAVASLRAQQGGPPRMVVVDDGSTDVHTQEVLRDLEGDPQVMLVRQENVGTSAARNRGLALVDTEFALVLDADDVLATGALLGLREALEAHPRAGYAYGHIEFFGDRAGWMRMPPFDPWRLLFRHIVGPTALMRRQMLADTGGYDVTFRHYEDWEIWIHALACGWDGVQIDVVTLLQRKHGPSKFDGDRANYRPYFNRIRAKHGSLYEGLDAVARRSALSAGERVLYRWVWGARPWPARAEAALYQLVFRASGEDSGARSTLSSAR